MHDIAAAAASPVFGVPLSVLDVAPVSSDRSPVEALADSTALVQEAERLGYHRLWYAEHHNMPGIASSAPEVLIANAGRDHAHPAGLGRRDAAQPRAAGGGRAVRDAGGSVPRPDRPRYRPRTRYRPAHRRRPAPCGCQRRLPQQLHELFGFFEGFEPGEDYRGIRAIPGWRRPARRSGCSDRAASVPRWRVRWDCRLPSPTTSAPHNTVPALDLYREHFRPSEILDKPYPMVTAMVVCAPDDDEANLLASAIALSFARMRSGYPPARLPTVADIEAHEWTPQERAFVESWLAPQVIGSPETVRRRMTELLAETGVAEFMATTNAPSATARTRSYQLLAELAELPRDEHGSHPRPSSIRSTAARTSPGCSSHG